jgi:hypothetical protein
MSPGILTASESLLNKRFSRGGEFRRSSAIKFCHWVITVLASRYFPPAFPPGSPMGGEPGDVKGSCYPP